MPIIVAVQDTADKGQQEEEADRAGCLTAESYGKASVLRLLLVLPLQGASEKPTLSERGQLH